MITLDRLPQTKAPLTEARRRLAEPKAGEPAFRMVGAAALLAVSACCLAMAVILGPFWRINNPQIIPTLTPAPAVHQLRVRVAPRLNAIVAAPPPPTSSGPQRDRR